MAISMFEPRKLIGVWEQVKRSKSFLRDFVFRGRYQSMEEHIDLDEVTSNRIMAPFSSLSGSGSTVARAGFQARTYTPPMVAPKFVTKALDLMSRMAGEAIYSGSTAQDRSLQLAMADMRKLDDMIARREEWMCAQLLFSGEVAMVGDDYSETLTFGHTNTDNLTGADRWSEATGTPLTDLGAWALEVAKETGVLPTTCVMALDVWGPFYNNTEVQASLDLNKQALAKLAPREAPNGARFMGVFTCPVVGDIDIYTYPEWYEEDVAGTLTRYPMVPDGTIALFDPLDSFLLAHGAYIDLETEPATVNVADRYPRSWYEKGPNQRFLQLISRPLVAPTRTNAWFWAKVLNAA